jgi:hypothetical protein
MRDDAWFTTIVRTTPFRSGGSAWTRETSIEDLKRALAKVRPRTAIVVSTRLFGQLYEGAELRPRKHKWQPPSDAACKKVLDTYLQLEKLPMSDQLYFVTWHLLAHDGIRVVKDADLFMTLRDRGANSFVFV